MTTGQRHRSFVVFVPIVLATSIAGTIFGFTLEGYGLGPFGPALIALFVALFSWIAFWFWLTAIGACCVWRARRQLFAVTATPAPCEPAPPLSPPTAVVVPIHNEDPESVFARIEAMLESVAETGNASAFEFFVLSDTSEPDVWLREELCWSALRRDRRGPPSLYYRRRPHKFRRKSGNIAEFCERWGRRYRYMIVLDADSVMDGRTMCELVSRMEHAPRLGILQAPSMPAMRHSLYARVQQFAASVYAPPIFAGLAYCFQDHGNFWGHNAIIRVGPFIEHCGLPGLPGRPPFGGPILSHDFVEAGLMRRAGFDVRLAWDLVLGSYEQCPVSLANAALRDRRWCQGNLQHLRLILSPSFSRRSRAHFAIGVLFYFASTLWGLFVALYAGAYLRSSTATVSLDVSRGAASLGLFVMMLSLLFLAKAVGVALVLADPVRERAHGGAWKLVTSACIEGFISVLTAPILMVTHIACLSSVVFGLTVDWCAADRDETRSPWVDAVRAHGWQSALGFLIAVSARSAIPGIFWWLAPIWVGLLSAVPLAAILSSRRAGTALRRRGLLLTPPETGASPILERVTALTTLQEGPQMDFEGRFRKFIRDPWFNTLHVALLRATEARSRPRHVVEPLVLRMLSLGADALNTEDALAVLSDTWAMQTLHEESGWGEGEP